MTLVLVHAVQTHAAKWLIIIQSVVVLLALPEILSRDALLLKKKVRIFFSLYFHICCMNICYNLSEPNDPENPCVPSPCGPNSQCRVIGTQAACSCVPNYIGQPPNCRPECTINAECPSNLACIKEKCQDPCLGSCGVNALCSVVNHNAICTCISGYEGDPTMQCSTILYCKLV